MNKFYYLSFSKTFAFRNMEPCFDVILIWLLSKMPFFFASSSFISSSALETTRSSNLELVDILPECCRMSLIISLNGCSVIKQGVSLYLREHNSILCKDKNRHPIKSTRMSLYSIIL